MVASVVCSFDVLVFSTLIRNRVVEIDSIYNLSTVVLDNSRESCLQVPNLFKHQKRGLREELHLCLLVP